MRLGSTHSGLFAVVVILVSSAFSAPTALAQSGGRDETSTVGKQYDKEIARGLTLAKEGNLDQAERAFVAAHMLRDRAPQAHYYLGELHRRANKLADALGDLEKALKFAELAKDIDMQGRAQSSLAVTLERMGEIQRAREVWIKAAKFAETNPNTALSANTAHAHIQAIDLVFEREHVYIGVRQRISDRERITGQKS